jgi:hypothetical protein
MSLIALVLLISGVVLWLLALRHRTSEAPSLATIRGYYPGNWKVVWKQRHWFTPVGFRYYWIGTTLIVAGGLIAAVFVF